MKSTIRDAFEFLKLFEDTVDEVATQTDDGESLELLQRRVVDKVLSEIKKQPQYDSKF